MSPPPPLPPSFSSKKSIILSSLSTPTPDYRDLSPKGSVDVGIIPLIDQINALEGLVTTSSCAGRISVFLEGRKGDTAAGGKGAGGKWLFVSHEPVRLNEGVKLSRLLFGLDGENGAAGEGKEEEEEEEEEESAWIHHRRKKDDDNSSDGRRGSRSCRRIVRFQFEPMILHILTASLHHAQPLLTAAINAGFRESGVQNLKNVHDPSSCPMVAIRTTGLALESIIGVVSTPASSSSTSPFTSEFEFEIDENGIQAGEEDDDNDDDDDDNNNNNNNNNSSSSSSSRKRENLTKTKTKTKTGTGTRTRRTTARPIVNESYLQMLVEFANERFEANRERIDRLRVELLEKKMGDDDDDDYSSRTGGSSISRRHHRRRHGHDWEDKETRRNRKREEGLERQREVRKKKKEEEEEEVGSPGPLGPLDPLDPDQHRHQHQEVSEDVLGYTTTTTTTPIS